MAQFPQPWPTRSGEGLSLSRSNPFAPPSARPEAPPSFAGEGKNSPQEPGGQDPSILFLRLAESARGLTGASAAALACLRDGAIRCEARSGGLAPPLGAVLDANSGISGECLRSRKPVRCRDTESDERVNREVCRELGLRSVAAVPILEGSAGVGLLEVFSDQPNAFTTEHLDILLELAGLAASARRAGTPGGTTAPVGEEEVQQAHLQAVRQAIASAAPKPRPHQSLRKWLPIGIPALLLTVAAVAGGWRFGMFSARDTAGASAAPRNDATVQTQPATQGSLLPMQEAKPSAAQTGANRALGVESAATRTGETGPSESARAPRLVEGGRLSQPNSSADSSTDTPVPAPDLTGNEVAATSTLSGILDPNTATVPDLRLPISQGVTGGKLRKRVSPEYPSVARSMNLEGVVVLEATVKKDGSIENLKVVKGPPVLGVAAMAAVRQWRYEPFLLNNEPVSVQTSIQIEFKLPR
jgi:TonB family protein